MILDESVFCTDCGIRTSEFDRFGRCPACQKKDDDNDDSGLTPLWA